MSDSLLRGLARLIDAHPRRIAGVGLVATVLAAALVVRLPVTADLLDVMPENTPSIVAFTDFLRDFGILNGLVVVVESPEPSPDALIAAVQSLGEQLSASPYAASVDFNLLQSGSRFVATHFPLYLDGDGVARLATRLSAEGVREQMRKNREALVSPLASPLDGELIGRDPLNIRELIQASLIQRLPAASLDLSTGYYLDRSHRLALLTVRPSGSVRDMVFVRGLHREVSRIAAQTVGPVGPSGALRVGLAGGYARAAEALGVIWQDMVVSFSVSLVLVLLILYAAFRPSPMVMGVFVVTLCASLAWTLLLAYLLYGTLNIITSIVAAMLIGLFVDYIIQTFRRFREFLRADGDPRRAMELTLAGTGKAILSGALTTSVGFFSVVVTSFRGLHELGVVAGFGILFCLAATLFLLTSLLAWIAQRRPTSLLAHPPSGLGEAWIARFVDGRGRALAVGFVLLLAASLAAATRVGFDASLESVGLRESAVQGVRNGSRRSWAAAGSRSSWWLGLRTTVRSSATLTRWSGRASAGGVKPWWAVFLRSGCCYRHRRSSGTSWRVSRPAASGHGSMGQNWRRSCGSRWIGRGWSRTPRWTHTPPASRGPWRRATWSGRGSTRRRRTRARGSITMRRRGLWRRT